MKYVCAFNVMELLRITRQIHCKAVEQRVTLIQRHYNRDWGTSYSGPPIDPYPCYKILAAPPGGRRTDLSTGSSVRLQTEAVSTRTPIAAAGRIDADVRAQLARELRADAQLIACARIHTRAHTAGLRRVLLMLLH